MTKRPGYWTVDEAMTWMMFGEATTSLMRTVASSLDGGPQPAVSYAEAETALGALLRAGTVSAIATDRATGAVVHMDPSEFSFVSIAMGEREATLGRHKDILSDRLALGGSFNLLRIRSDELVSNFVRTSAKAKRGRRPTYEWDEFEAKVEELLIENGTLQPWAGEDIPNQAALERKMLEWTETEWQPVYGKVPSESQVREHVVIVLGRRKGR